MPSSLALPPQRDNELLPMHHRESGGSSRDVSGACCVTNLLTAPWCLVPRLITVSGRLSIDANTDYAAIDSQQEANSPIVYVRVSRQHPPLPTSLVGYGPDSRLSSP
ncbi:hypothetical protein R3P38DRAFT_3178595 [Favolaschia claudopus]|uniref:Uncharacterized protein n=1 Tax=Favolaschia claudopus TaxID=2862362 RepID=A0AAW0CRW7_9AGAR